MSFKNDTQRKAVMALLRSQALQTRRWAERVQKVKPGSERVFDDRFGKDLSGFCLRASARLAHQLEKRGIRTKIVLASGGGGWGGQHAYVIARNHILDVTATQFKGPKVRVLPYKRARRVNDIGQTADYYRGSGGEGWGRTYTYPGSVAHTKRFRRNIQRQGWAEGTPIPADFKRFNKKAYK